MEYNPWPCSQLVMAGVCELAFPALPYLNMLWGLCQTSLAQWYLGYGLIWECSPVSGRPGRICLCWCQCHSDTQPPDGAAVWLISASLCKDRAPHLCGYLCVPGGTLVFTDVSLSP